MDKKACPERPLARFLIGFAVLVSLMSALWMLWLITMFFYPQTTTEQAILITPGMSVRQVSQQLFPDKKVQAFSFELWFRLQPRCYVQAGYYVLPRRASFVYLAQSFHKGRIKTYPVFIRPGLYPRQIADVFWRSGVWPSRTYTTLEKMVEEAIENEHYGFLWAQTHDLKYDTDWTSMLVHRDNLLAQEIAQVWETRSEQAQRLERWQQAVVLASLVEKEAGQGEHAHIAGVLFNRLAKRMRLQCDASVHRAVHVYDAPLRKEDLQSQSPYNTYRYHGLPPHPIGSFSQEALYAVLHPEQTDDLYFVSHGQGGHVFAKTLDDHIRHVQNYRKQKEKS